MIARFNLGVKVGHHNGLWISWGLSNWEILQLGNLKNSKRASAGLRNFENAPTQAKRGLERATRRFMDAQDFYDPCGREEPKEDDRKEPER
jgi:hypothetical protein